MNRSIAGVAILLVLLIGLDRVRTNQREAERRLASTIRPLPGTEDRTISAVHELQVTYRDTTWVYRLIGKTWRYPADHNAFVLAEPLKHIVEGIVDTRGTAILHPHKDIAHYGLDDSQRLLFHLSDSISSWGLTVHVGRSLPGQEAQEAFMRVEGTDTLFHAHADPRPILFRHRVSGRPPLIDLKVLPSALDRQAITRVAFPESKSPVRYIERIEVEKQKGANPKPQDGPIYEWRGAIQNRAQKVSNAAVYAYLGFLRRLRYDALLDPAKRAIIHSQNIVLTYNDGISDTLTVGQLSEGGAAIENRTTGQLMRISKAKMDLLFLSTAQLDSLPEPSPYDLAQPLPSFGSGF